VPGGQEGLDPPNPARFGNFARIGLCAIVFTLATWNWFTWKGIVAFIPFWVLFEVFTARACGRLWPVRTADSIPCSTWLT